MTVKVYMNDGKIEEYPNAHITWEWDEDEKGTDSGWRVHAIDRNYTTVSAFIYPSECSKIEITHEKCDMVFVRPPFEGGISGKRFRIFSEIDKERKRQDDKWNVQNHPMVRVPEHIAQNKKLADALKVVNDTEKFDWCSILLEEVYEAFSETDPEKQRVEMIQVAAVAVNTIEYLDRKKESEEK